MPFFATVGRGQPAVVVYGSPPLLAGVCRLWWGVFSVGVSLVVCVCGVCGCARWLCCVVRCVLVVSAWLVVWCGGVAWVCLSHALVCVVACVLCGGCVGVVGSVVSVPRHSWLRDLGAVPRHFWLWSAAVWWWLVPCHPWLRVLVADPRHSWLGFATGCSGWSLATPG